VWLVGGDRASGLVGERGRRAVAAGVDVPVVEQLVVARAEQGQVRELGASAVFVCDEVVCLELARSRENKHLTSATKSNGIIHTMPFWDECFHEMAAQYPDIRTDQYHIDILTAHFVRHPDWFDVVVGSNLFGDILSDLGPAVVGSIGIAPSANLNPEKEYPSMFEPVHGSAPDIAGKGIANPIGQIWSGAMMLRHLGVPAAADAIENAITLTLAQTGVRTPDIGGNATTSDIGKEIAAKTASTNA